jgi:hypothetical protein
VTHPDQATFAFATTPPKPPRSRYHVSIAGRTLTTTAAFDSYWYLASERQAIFYRRLRNDYPLTNDLILNTHRFTNTYRASDRVSQYLLSNVIAKSEPDPRDLLFRILLFKFFNRIDTWEALTRLVGNPSLANYTFARYRGAFDDLMAQGQKIYSSAYIMPSPPFGENRKHANHLRLLERMLADDLPRQLTSAPSIEAAYKLLLAYPSLGPFLAFQFTIDLNYSPLLNFSEMDFVVAGPGAQSGIEKCFVSTEGIPHSTIIASMTAMLSRETQRLGIHFNSLWGRPVQLIDAQNLFCETDKYAREAHPTITSASDRTKIKQRYHRNPQPIIPAYPAKWELTGTIPGLPQPQTI